jgi:hypothetical protein
MYNNSHRRRGGKNGVTFEELIAKKYSKHGKISIHRFNNLLKPLKAKYEENQVGMWLRSYSNYLAISRP